MHADDSKFAQENSSSMITQRIESFFVKHPDKLEFLWVPEIRGKSRYVLSIPRQGYNISKKYADASDLYYQTKKIDNKLLLHSNNLKNIDFFWSEDSYELKYKQNTYYDYNVGVFLKNKNHLGLSIGKEFVLLKNSLGNLNIDLSDNLYPLIQSQYVNLLKNENSELFINTNYSTQLNNLESSIGYVWFDLLDQFDFTIGINQKKRKILPEAYATFGDDKMKFQIGFNQGKYNSNTKMFISLVFKNITNNQKFNTNLTLNSKHSLNENDNLSLKNFRKKSLDQIWRKRMHFD